MVPHLVIHISVCQLAISHLIVVRPAFKHLSFDLQPVLEDCYGPSSSNYEVEQASINHFTTYSP